MGCISKYQCSHITVINVLTLSRLYISVVVYVCVFKHVAGKLLVDSFKHISSNVEVGKISNLWSYGLFSLTCLLSLYILSLVKLNRKLSVLQMPLTSYVRSWTQTICPQNILSSWIFNYSLRATTTNCVHTPTIILSSRCFRCFAVYWDQLERC